MPTPDKNNKIDVQAFIDAQAVQPDPRRPAIGKGGCDIPLEDGLGELSVRVV